MLRLATEAENERLRLLEEAEKARLQLLPVNSSVLADKELFNDVIYTELPLSNIKKANADIKIIDNLLPDELPELGQQKFEKTSENDLQSIKQTSEQTVNYANQAEEIINSEVTFK